MIEHQPIIFRETVEISFLTEINKELGRSTNTVQKGTSYLKGFTKGLSNRNRKRKSLRTKANSTERNALQDNKQTKKRRKSETTSVDTRQNKNLKLEGRVEN